MKASWHNITILEKVNQTYECYCMFLETHSQYNGSHIIKRSQESANDLDIRKIICIRCEWIIKSIVAKRKERIFCNILFLSIGTLISEMKRKNATKTMLKKKLQNSFIIFCLFILTSNLYLNNNSKLAKYSETNTWMVFHIPKTY